jgi:DNA-directed RNA polymerase subunit RPC12/RpoP
MAQVFNCPSCGASLDYEGDDDPVVRCPYCNSTVIVPECLLSQAHKQQPPARAATTPLTASPLTIDLSGLTGNIAILKAVKQRVREGQESEAARLYQEAFGASAEEAEGVVKQAGVRAECGDKQWGLQHAHPGCVQQAGPGCIW